MLVLLDLIEYLVLIQLEYERHFTDVRFQDLLLQVSLFLHIVSEITDDVSVYNLKNSSWDSSYIDRELHHYAR